MRRWRIPTFPIDRRLAEAIASGRARRIEVPLRKLTWLADEKLLLAAGTLYWLGVRMFDGARRRQADHLLLTLGVTAALPHVLKRFAAQERPDRIEVHGKRHGVPRSGKAFDAFPSGHAVHMGALAMALSRMFPKRRSAIWTAALGIAFTRVVLLAHWLSDVVVGSATGAGIESLLHHFDRGPEG